MGLSAYPKTVTSSKYILLFDRKSYGASGGTFTSGAWRTRDLNSIEVDDTGEVTLASNQFTLPAGTYEIHAIAPAYRVDGHQARLRNVSDSESVLFSGSGNCPSGGDQQFVHILGKFTISSSKTFELQHFCNTTKSGDGFGQRAQLSGQSPLQEIFSMVELRKMETIEVVEFTCS